MKTLSIKLFNSNISKILEEVSASGGEILLTKYNKPYVSIKGCKHLTPEDKKVANIPNLITSREEVEKRFPTVNTYGCGCERDDNRLCQKHQRA